MAVSNLFKVTEVFKHAKRHKSSTDYRGETVERIPESDLRDCDSPRQEMHFKDACTISGLKEVVLLVAPKNVKIVSIFLFMDNIEESISGSVSRVKLCRDTEIKPKEDR